MIAVFAFALSVAAIFIALLGPGGLAADALAAADRTPGLRGLLAAALLLVPSILLPRLAAAIATRGRGQPLVTWCMAVNLLAAVIAAGGIAAREGLAIWVALGLDGIVGALLGPLVLSALYRRLATAARLPALALALSSVFLGAGIGIGLAHVLLALPGGGTLLALALVVIAGAAWWLTRRLAAGTVGAPPADDEADLAVLARGGVIQAIDRMRAGQLPWAAALGIAWFHRPDHRAAGLSAGAGAAIPARRCPGRIQPDRPARPRCQLRRLYRPSPEPGRKPARPGPRWPFS